MLVVLTAPTASTPALTTADADVVLVENVEGLIATDTLLVIVLGGETAAIRFERVVAEIESL